MKTKDVFAADQIADKMKEIQANLVHLFFDHPYRGRPVEGCWPADAILRQMREYIDHASGLIDITVVASAFAKAMFTIKDRYNEERAVASPSTLSEDDIAAGSVETQGIG